MADLPRGTVTFLFTDIQDSTRLWEQYPEETSQALTRHDEIIESLAQQHNGFVVRPRGEGDSRFAVFVRAIDGVNAAAAIQQALYNEAWPEEIALRVRIGIHTGEGEFRDGDYYGTAVNRCARLRGIAHGGQAVISQSTYELVQDNLLQGVELLDLGKQSLKGLQRPEHIYQLTAPGTPAEFPPLKGANGVDTASAQLPAFLLDEEIEIQRPVFVARERELEKLNGLLQQALDGHGQVAFVSGGPGRGKSALLGEFSTRAMKAHPQLLATSGHYNAYAGVGDPYLPFREVMGSLSGDVEASWKAGAISTDHARRLWSALPQTVSALLDYGPHILGRITSGKELLGRAELALADDDDPTLYQLRVQVSRDLISEGIEQSHLFEQYTNVLRKLSQSYPLILMLDDLQWADTSSIGLLFHLGRRLEGCRILILGAYRPEEVALGRDGERHPLKKILAEFKRSFGDVVVDLTAEFENKDRHFVDAFLASEPNRLDEHFTQTLFEHTGGHPLFTVELIRTMQDRGDLVQEDGVWMQSPSLDWERLPARIEAVIEERIERLSDELREILSVASVEGEDFTAQVVHQVQQVSEKEILRKLSQELEKRHRLVRAGGEYQIGDQNLSRYKFAHSLFQQYLYNSLSEGERRLLHREVGTVLETLYEGRLEDVAVQLAHHFHGDPARERKYAKLAGEQAVAHFDFEEAVQYFSRALELTPETNQSERVDLLLARENALNIIGNRDDQFRDLNELFELTSNLDLEEDKTSRSAEVALRLGQYHVYTNNYSAAITALHKSIKMAELVDDFVIQTQAYRHWTIALMWQGQYDEMKRKHKTGLELAQRYGLQKLEADFLYLFSKKSFGNEENVKKALEIYQKTGDKLGEARALIFLGICNIELHSNYKKAIDYTNESISISHKYGDKVGEVLNLNNFGYNFNSIGEYEKALNNYRQCLQISTMIGLVKFETNSLLGIGSIYLQLGNYEVASEYLEHSLKIARETENTPAQITAITKMGKIFLSGGDHQAAVETIREALGKTKAINDPRCEAYSYQCIGYAYLTSGMYREAEDSFRKAQKLNHEFVEPSLETENMAGLAALYLAQRETTQALSQVEKIFRH